MQLVIVAVGVLALLILILRIKLPAFVALLIVSTGVGLALGMQPAAVLVSIRDGMASTLGFIAVVVGLGAMFGALLEFAGGVQAIADRLVGSMGQSRALWALGVAGLLVGIPVFFDVGFIILVPLLQQLCERTGRSPIYFATPLLAGLLVGHAFIPPTPGPLAVAELLNADLGWVIAMGLVCGTPAMIVAGPLLARRFVNVAAHRTVALGDIESPPRSYPAPSISLTHALCTILLPLVLIVGNTAGQQLLPAGAVRTTLEFIGHPFVALLIACLYAYFAFGITRRVPGQQLQEIMTRSLEPAGLIVLVTGAGGVFKEILVDSGVGDLMGAFFREQALPPMLLAYALAALVRIAQGSATVAMITSAGLTAPVLQHLQLDNAHTALVVMAIAAGASIASHVNDSGFWLVSRCLNLTEAETLRTWTVISTLASIVGFATASLLAAVL
jgi:Gnt-I system low-affinity gluconate transporter